MKRTYLILLAVVACAAALGMFIAEHTGYVLISWKSFRYESSLWMFLAVLATVLALLYGLRTLIKMTLVSTGLINPWSNRNQSRRLRLAAEQGILDLAQGNWKDALRHLRRASEGEAKPLVYLLGAANAAEKLGYSDEADALLEQALIKQPSAEVAIALAHADLQLQRADDSGALETLQAMHELHPQHPEVLLRLQALLRQRQDWSALIGLLPALRKCKRLNSAQLQKIEYQAWSGRLAAACNLQQSPAQALKSLDTAWQGLSGTLKSDHNLVAAYAKELLRLNAHEQAESLLRHALKNDLHDGLLDLYGQTQAKDLTRQLQAAEGWLKQAPHNAVLLRALGRLSLRNQLWGKARDYFESSLREHRQAHTCAELARLLSHLGDTQRSNQLFAESFQLLEQSLPVLPLPAPAKKQS